MMVKEFCAFMRGHYGADWAFALKELRFKNVHDRVPLERKRTRGVEEELSRYQDGELLRDAEAGCDAISCLADSDWWAWQQGSTLFFWRWAEGQQRRYARDGMEVHIIAKLPKNQRPACPPMIKKEK